jgi:hypothetical protein
MNCLIIAGIIVVLVIPISFMITPRLDDPDERKDFLEHL